MKKINIYTDGSLIKKNINESIAGYGIYIPDLKIMKAFNLNEHNKTHNRAELWAIITSIKYFTKESNIELNIYTDSQYCIWICTSTGEKYKKNNYLDSKGNDVKNRDLVEIIMDLRSHYNIKMHHVRSHTNKTDQHSLGNKFADKLAVEGALTS